MEALDYYRLQGKYIRADVTDRKQIERGLEQLEEEGWFEGKEKIFCHLAGYSEDCPYEEITPSILKKHLEPKMKGAENLSGLAQRWESQLVLIGSITAVLGNPGQGRGLHSWGRGRQGCSRRRQGERRPG